MTSISNLNVSSWAIILNPLAGKGMAIAKWNVLSTYFEKAGIAYQVFETQKEGDEKNLTLHAYTKGFKSFLAIGGDGTASGVVNGMVEAAQHHLETCRFSLFPIGTGNDWSRTYRLPKDTATWWNNFRLQNTRQQKVGVLSVNGKNRYFINVAGMCFDAFVVKDSKGSTRFKGRSFYYLWAMSSALFKYKLPELSIHCDGKLIYTGKCYTVNAGICRYSGGGMQIVPHAHPADEQLAFTIAKKISKLGVLLCTPLFYLGKINWHPKAHLFKGKQLEVRALTGQLQSEADGEYLGEGDVKIHTLPWALHCVV